MTSQAKLEFTPIETGDMTKIPPSAPPGEWMAVAKVRLAKTSADGLPMFIIDWKLVEALTDGNDDHTGSTVTEFLVFRASNDPNVRMSREQLKAICDNLQIDPPSVTKIESSDDLAEFQASIEGTKAKIWTFLKEDKRSGEMATQIRHTAPRGGIRAVVDDEDEKPAKKGAKAPAKKTGKR